MQKRTLHMKTIVLYTGVPIGLLLGIIAGILVNQSHYISLGFLLGWFLFPIEVGSVITQIFSPGSVVQQIGFLTTLYYPFAFICYGLCAFWVARRTHSIEYGMWSALLATFITGLAAVFSGAFGILSQDFNSGTEDFSSLAGYYSSLLAQMSTTFTLLIHGVYSIPHVASTALFFSPVGIVIILLSLPPALLGAWFGCWLAKRFPLAVASKAFPL